MENETSGNTWIKIAGAIVIIAGIAYGVYALKNKPSDNSIISNDNTAVPPPSNTPPQAPPPTLEETKKYRDGTYSATGNYTSPAQKEEVGVELVIKDDVVISAKFTEHPSNPTTATMQGKFKAGFSTLVVGKKLDDIKLTVVNGSSLTPKGFMDALSKIKLEAAA